jgi:nucleoprotein TPR
MADVALPPGVDPYRLSTFLSVPESDILSLASISQPFVSSVLEAIARKANEFDELRADKLRLEVELEQAVRTADSRVRSMKGQLDEALQETQGLRAKVEQTGLFIPPPPFPSAARDMLTVPRICACRVRK